MKAVPLNKRFSLELVNENNDKQNDSNLIFENYDTTDEKIVSKYTIVKLLSYHIYDKVFHLPQENLNINLPIYAAVESFLIEKISFNNKDYYFCPYNAVVCLFTKNIARFDEFGELENE